SWGRRSNGNEFFSTPSIKTEVETFLFMGKAIEWKLEIFPDGKGDLHFLPLHGEGDRMETCLTFVSPNAG
ncbi:hypothetical protein, partial [Parathermosynechococcus lividus]